MKTLLTLAILLAAAPAALADGLPDYGLSTLTIATPGQIMMRVHPDGSGPAFTEALQRPGQQVDGTVTLLLLDGFGLPIFGFPAEDIWLAPFTGGLELCGSPVGLIPDHDTDVNGMTEWVAAKAAGGYSSGVSLVYVNGIPLTSSVGLDLCFTSPDLNGDGTVSLSDGGMFTGDLFGVYAERSDLNWDGVINLSDVGIIADAMGSGCGDR